MTRKQALTELRDKVKAGDYLRWGHFAKGIGLRPDDRHISAHWAYNGSLDAAKALHEAVLPAHRARLDVGRRNRAWIVTPDNKKTDAYADTPARAWLLAILEALIAQEPDT